MDVLADLDLHFSHFGQINLKVNSADADETAWMCWLIWIYTVLSHNKGVFTK
jgi:hypothetical protein